MSTETRQTAKSLFLSLTGDTGRIDRLWGPANAPNRAAILSVLIGKKIFKSNPQAGWNRFRRAMLNLHDIATQGLCIAQEDDALRDAATQSPEPETMESPRDLTTAQERRLNRFYCINEPGGGKWETMRSLIDKGYVAATANRLTITPEGQAYCQLYGPQMPI